MMWRGTTTALIAMTWLSAGCGLTKVYSGSAIDISPAQIRTDPGWVKLDGVEPVLQRESQDCGAAAMTMVLQYFGEQATLDGILVELGAQSSKPIAAGDMRDLARRHGFQAFLLSAQESDLIAQIQKGRPVLVGLVKPTAGREFIAHFEVVIGVHPEKREILTIDPARGYRQNSWAGFAEEWTPAKQLALVVLPLSP